MSAHLELDDVACGYKTTSVIHQLNLAVAEGSTTALVGANGAGKTALLRAVAGLEPITAGRMLLDGRDVTSMDALGRARLGVRLVSSERHLFADMTVADHLRVAVDAARQDSVLWWRRHRHGNDAIRAVLASFPRLAERQAQRAATMSGGEQQMLALARALVATPRLLLLDEPSAGLAPSVIGALYQALQAWGTDRNVTLIVAEQQPSQLLAMADRAIVLQRGSIVADGMPSAVAADGQLWHHYGGDGQMP